MKRYVTFGEIMIRLSSPGFLRLQQAVPGPLDANFAGAEANVAASLAMLGAEATFVTALPADNPLADACIYKLRGIGVHTERILRRDSGRLGIFFVETGANERPSRVTYDREHSAIGLAPPDAYDWSAIFSGEDWFHFTGITPALSKTAAEATVQAARRAREAGLTVSCDLNFRSKLWRWEAGVPPRPLAGRTMREVLPYVDVLIANEADCGDVLDIHAGASNVEEGEVDVAAYPDLARQVIAQFPNIRYVATTLRESVSASHNNWGAMLYDAAEHAAYFAPRQGERYAPYAIRNIVDRVGGGDAFAAGLIFALAGDDFPTPRAAVDFAAAASCLAHSVPGDFNYASRAEIEALMRGSASGRVVR